MGGAFPRQNLRGGLYGRRFSKIKIWEAVYMGGAFPR